MKTKSTPQSAFFSPRLIIPLALFSGGVFLVLYALGAFSNAFAQGKGSSAAPTHNATPMQPLDSMQEAWVARYTGPLGNGVDQAEAIATDSSGNVYVTGYSYSNTFKDYATVKYDASGQQQWVRRYNGPGNDDDDPTAIGVDQLGNVYVTGSSIGAAGFEQYTTIKYNAAGQQQWVARYGSDTSIATAIAVDDHDPPNIDVYVTGYSYDPSAIRYDYVTIKYNSSGQQQWVKRLNRFAGNNDAFATAIVFGFDYDRGFYAVWVTGYQYDTSGHSGYYTLEYDLGEGQFPLAQTYYTGCPQCRDSFATGMASVPGQIFVTGYSSSYSGANYDYLTLAYSDDLGTLQWAQTYNGPGNGDDYATAIVCRGSNVVVTGSSAGSGTGNDYATIKYNLLGDELWVARYNGPGNGDDGANALALGPLDNVYVTGSSQGAATGSDYATIKYDSAGQQEWVARYNGPGNGDDLATAIAVDELGNVDVTGSSLTSGTNVDYATVKYVQIPSATPTPTATPATTATPTSTPTATPRPRPTPRSSPTPHPHPTPPPRP